MNLSTFVAPSCRQTGLTKEKFLANLVLIDMVKSPREHKFVSRLLLTIPGFHEYIRDIFIAASNGKIKYDIEKSPFRNIIYNTINNDPSSIYWLQTYGLKLIYDILPKEESKKEFKIEAVNPFSSTLPKWCRPKSENDPETESDNDECEEHNDVELNEEDMRRFKHMTEHNDEDERSEHTYDNEEKSELNDIEIGDNKRRCPYCTYTTRSGHMKRHIEGKHNGKLNH